MRTFAFIDASNLFYGGEKSLGWKIDYKRLLRYLEEKPVLKHLKSIGKEVVILGRGPRTAKEIKQFAGDNFRDFEYLRERLKMKEK